jgi:hypothetical protein
VLSAHTPRPRDPSVWGSLAADNIVDTPQPRPTRAHLATANSLHWRSDRAPIVLAAEISGKALVGPSVATLRRPCSRATTLHATRGWSMNKFFRDGHARRHEPPVASHTQRILRQADEAHPVLHPSTITRLARQTILHLPTRRSCTLPAGLRHLHVLALLMRACLLEFPKLLRDPLPPTAGLLNSSRRNRPWRPTRHHHRPPPPPARPVLSARRH